MTQSLKACWLMLMLPVVCFLAPSCGGDDDDDDTATTANDDDDTASPYEWDRAKLTENGHYMIYVAAIPDPIPFNDLFKLSIMVHDGEQTSLMYDDATLAVDATMPAHAHGMTTEPTVTREPSGSFIVEGMQLHMAGDWEMVLSAERAGVSDRAVINIKCCEP